MEKKNEVKCFRGHTSGTCPKVRLENEKIVYAVLLIVAIGIAVMRFFGCGG